MDADEIGISLVPSPCNTHCGPITAFDSGTSFVVGGTDWDSRHMPKNMPSNVSDIQREVIWLNR